jgi:predicted dehydrogenase
LDVSDALTTTIVGLGKIGFSYDLAPSGSLCADQIMTHVRAVSQNPNTEVTYLVDSNIEALSKAKLIFGGSSFTSISDLLKNSATDILIISTPTTFHLQNLAEILEIWSPKMIILEKPCGSNSNEAWAMVDKTRVLGSVVFVNYFRRYLPNFTQAHNFLHLADPGILKKVTIYGYGSLLNIFSHFLDIVIFFAGTSALTLGEKYIEFENSGHLTCVDLESKVTYSFLGIGKGQRDCELLIEFENLTVFVGLNGRTIRIMDENNLEIRRFDSSNLDYLNYQAWALDGMLREFKKHGTSLGLADAIHVHKFIETI